VLISAYLAIPFTFVVNNVLPISAKFTPRLLEFSSSIKEQYFSKAST